MPAEPAVQAALAEAEFDAGDDEAALRAADKALATAPGNMTALIQKGYALTRAAGKTKTEEAWLAARRGDQSFAGEALKQLDAACRRQRVTWCDSSVPQAALGHLDHAFASLEERLRQRDCRVLSLSIDPRLKSLHKRSALAGFHHGDCSSINYRHLARPRPRTTR